MTKRFFFILIFLPLFSFGQQESYYSLYSFNMNVINPAYAGADATNMLSLTSRRQWTSIENAPSTIALAFSSARKNNVGLGVSVVSDKIFVEQQTFAYVDFSYKLEMGSDAQLFLGLKGGGNFYRADPTLLNTYDPVSDPTQIALSRFNPNIGAGAYYKASSYWVSFSIPRLINSKRDDELVVNAKDRVHTYLGAGAVFGVGENFQLKPSFMMRKIKGLPITTDLTGMLSWQNTFDVGVSFRSNSAISLLSVISLGKFDIGYAYETPTDGGLSQLNLKTHELVFRIRLGEIDKTTKDESTSTEE
jgi:type IX secretion system PorP/SprF family membrane protein